MTEYLETISEPCRLILAWQSSDLRGENRYRYAVGQVEPTSGTFRYFQPGVEFEVHNQGKPHEEMAALGYRGYPAFDPSRQLHDTGVMEALMRRLPPRTRSDFDAYAARFLLPPNSRLSDATLLGRTEATLPSDGFSVVDPLDPSLERCDLLLEVAGFRHYAAKVDVRVGQPVAVVADPANAYDANAVEFTVDGGKFGNVNRLQAATFRRWLVIAEVGARIERLNGTPERPRAFVRVKVRPKAGAFAATGGRGGPST